MVLAASGVEHQELVKYAEPLLADLPSATPLKEPKSVYVGGDSRVYAGSQVGYSILYIYRTLQTS